MTDISRYFQDVCLAAIGAAIDHVQLIDGSLAPIGVPVPATFGRKGLVLTNLTPISISGVGAALLALQQGATTLTYIYWGGGYAQPGQLVFSLGAS